MGPIAYQAPEARNEDMEGRFRTGLSYVPSAEETRSQEHIMLTRLEVLVLVLVSVAKPPAKDLHQWKIPCLRLTKPVYLPCGMLALPSLLGTTLTPHQEGPFTGIH